jgi:hypothetical protein
VHWRLLARTGLTTAGTWHLLQREAGLQADLAVVVTGVNDVVDQVPSHHAVAAREALANWLRNAAGVQHVAFAPLPPVHAFPGLPQPLRWVAGADARRHNRALRDWAATRGDVSMRRHGTAADPGGDGRDGFHPGAAGLPPQRRGHRHPPGQTQVAPARPETAHDPQPEGKTLVITGASRGIGLAIATRAAADGANVVLLAKTVEPNPKLPGTLASAARG